MNKYDRERLMKKYVGLITEKVLKLYDPDLAGIDTVFFNNVLEISFIFGKLYEESNNAFSSDEGIKDLFCFINVITSLEKRDIDEALIKNYIEAVLGGKLYD